MIFLNKNQVMGFIYPLANMASWKIPQTVIFPAMNLRSVQIVPSQTRMIIYTDNDLGVPSGNLT